MARMISVFPYGSRVFDLCLCAMGSAYPAHHFGADVAGEHAVPIFIHAGSEGERHLPGVTSPASQVSAFGSARRSARKAVNFPRVDAELCGDQVRRNAKAQHMAGEVGLSAVLDLAAADCEYVKRNPCGGICDRRHVSVLSVVVRGERLQTSRHTVGAALVGTGAALTGVSEVQTLTPFISLRFPNHASGNIDRSSIPFVRNLQAALSLRGDSDKRGQGVCKSPALSSLNFPPVFAHRGAFAGCGA